jgi:hypothetical protein
MSGIDELSNEIIRNVFPEERFRFYRFLRQQKRSLRSWLFFVTILMIIFLSINLNHIIPYLWINFQTALNTTLVSWIITIVIFPFVWPFKRGDYFSDDFRNGLDPRIWQYDGNWKVELGEDGKALLTVTDSNIGGLALPCLPWTDYEVNFEMRILNLDGGWIIRASGLYDYVHQKLNKEKIVTLYRISGVFPKVGEMKHGEPIKLNMWYPIRLLARGEWLSVYVKVNGKESLVFQDRALGDKSPIQVGFIQKIEEGSSVSSQQLIAPSFRSGSFGFRIHGEECAQYRKIRAYRLR